MTKRHFACTQCGKCCNRPPEVELGEAAELADAFVWQLLFRLYSLPRNLADYLAPEADREQASAEFFASKRLLNSFAAHTWNAKVRRGAQNQERALYLTISALALDTASGACGALEEDGSCGIYDRRPLSCRSVPLHYSRPEPLAATDFDTFLRLPGHACASGSDAPVLIESGRIANPDILAARAEALERAAADRSWKLALVKAMKAGRHGLPSLALVEQNAQHGALVAPIQFGWQVAVETGLLSAGDCAMLVARQIKAIERFLANPSIAPQARASAMDLRRTLGA